MLRTFSNQKSQSYFSVLTLIATGAMFGSVAPACAQDFTVHSGQTVGRQVMTGTGDRGLIEPGGTVQESSNFEIGVYSSGADTMIDNRGTVSTTGDYSDAIVSGGVNAVIINSGVITTAGRASTAIITVGTNAASSNSGTIVTTGLNSVGMFSAGLNGRVENSGTITTTATSSDGIRSFEDNVVIVSSGTITTGGTDAFGINSYDANAQIENSGKITTTGLRGYGISSEGTDARITSSGAITTSGDLAYAISTEGEDARVSNAGTITTTGLAAVGIRSLGTDAGIDNHGMIATTGQSSHGIYANGAGASVSNSGTIGTSGLLAYGIHSDEADARITNSGTIITTGIMSSGIRAEGTNASIANRGSVKTSGMQAPAIDASTANARIDNSGSLTTTGSRAQGILSSGSNARIGNSGTIFVSGSQALGILSSGANDQVINSGRIISEQFNAIVFFGAQNNVLTLKPGSVIAGGLAFGGGTDALVVKNGLSIVYTFDKAPEVLNAHGAPFVVSGVQVAVADPTMLANENEALADLTGGISSAVQSRLSSLRHGGPIAPGRDAWIQSFGTIREQAGDGAAAETDQRLAGVVSGMDASYSGSTRAGFFFGGSWGEIADGIDSQRTRIDSFFGGVYASTAIGNTAFDFMLTGGYSEYDRERDVGNNLVVGGIETATASYEGLFVSPEISITQPVAPFGIRLDQVLTLRYAGLFLDDFAESGASDGFGAGERDVHLGVARAALALPIESRSDDGGYGLLTLTGGVEARTQFGDHNVSGTLLGQAIVFDPNGDNSAIAGFVGVKGEHTTDDGFTAFVTLEGKVEDAGSHLVSGYGGFKWQF